MLVIDDKHQVNLPPVIAGPILRKTTVNEVTLWLATSAQFSPICTLTYEETELSSANKNMQLAHRCLHLGKHLFLHFIHITVKDALPYNIWINYDLALQAESSNKIYAMSDWASELYYQDKKSFGFILQENVSKLLHGSCRKPHFKSHHDTDGLKTVDDLLESTAPADWPSLLIMSGDQIYADDVAGPMLHAIHQVIHVLGLPNEQLHGSSLANDSELHTSKAYYYKRHELLPYSKATKALRKQFFGGVKKPVFTSDTAHNHLMTLSEMIAMYLLVWSPVCWRFVTLKCPQQVLSIEGKALYDKEKAVILDFRKNLSKVQRAMAHLPTAMIFDDHDVTDDWNLNSAWEQSAYENPLSRRIIGNALIAYLLFQGWGNQPSAFDDTNMDALEALFNDHTQERHDNLISDLLNFNNWHYEWPTSPPLVVLDTRTRRWVSEKKPNRPSGLMDWEALTDLQQTLINNQDAVILVSPAPIFGVKLIETVQRVFTWFGHPLMVDAENWMAHPGSAYALMNLFRHPKTPHNFIILSGDVHYSFVYDIKLKGRKNSPNIWQITSSGIKNEFPTTLLDWFDRLNRWLYAPWSPLNWFTKRRGMWVSARKPGNASKGERLMNHSGIGLVVLNDKGQPTLISQINDINNPVNFKPRSSEKYFE